MLKSKIQQVLKRAGIYERLRASFIYDFFWSIADRDVIKTRQNEVRFYRELLAPSPSELLIFDIGANHGQKTDVFLRLGAQVVAVDPDRSNQEILGDKFLRYRLRKKQVRILGKAVSDSISVATFWVDAPGSAKNTLSQKWVETLRHDKERFGSTLEFAGHQKVETTTLDAMMDTYGIPHFVKIDVEGHEPSVLRGLKRPVPYLSFEVNLPEFLLEGIECIEILGRLTEHGRFNWSPDCQGGLAMTEWLPSANFVEVFRNLKEKSVEVFWKT